MCWWDFSSYLFYAKKAANLTAGGVLELGLPFLPSLTLFLFLIFPVSLLSFSFASVTFSFFILFFLFIFFFLSSRLKMMFAAYGVLIVYYQPGSHIDNYPWCQGSRDNESRLPWHWKGPIAATRRLLHSDNRAAHFILIEIWNHFLWEEANGPFSPYVFFFFLPTTKNKKITNMKDLHIPCSKILTSWQAVNTKRLESTWSFRKAFFQSLSFCS